MKNFNGTEPEVVATEDYLMITLFQAGPKFDTEKPKDSPNEPKVEPKIKRYY